MKRLLYLCLLCLTLTGCAKAPMNGALDGQWQLLRYETTDGEVHDCRRLYYSIQLQVVELADKGGAGYGTYIGRFAYDEGRAEVVIRELRPRGDEGRLATTDELQPFGLFATDNVLHVVAVDDDHLTLRSDAATLYFRKF